MRGEFELWNGSSFLQVSDIPKKECSVLTVAKSVILGRRISCQCKGNAIQSIVYVQDRVTHVRAAVILK